MKIKINDTYHETKIDFDFLFLFDIVNLARVKGGTLQSLSIRSEREDRPKSKYFSQYDDWEMMLTIYQTCQLNKKYESYTIGATEMKFMIWFSSPTEACASTVTTAKD